MHLFYHYLWMSTTDKKEGTLQVLSIRWSQETVQFGAECLACACCKGVAGSRAGVYLEIIRPRAKQGRQAGQSKESGPEQGCTRYSSCFWGNPGKLSIGSLPLVRSRGHCRLCVEGHYTQGQVFQREQHGEVINSKVINKDDFPAFSIQLPL